MCTLLFIFVGAELILYVLENSRKPDVSWVTTTNFFYR